MTKSRVRKVCLLLASLLVCMAAGTAGTRNINREQPYIAVIVKSTDSSFWKSVFSGANAAGTEYNVRLTLQGSKSEDDYETQNQLIRQAAADGAQAIVVSAVDYYANADAVEEAAKKGVKIVVIDSDVNSSLVSCRIGTDDREAGRMAGRTALLAKEEKLYIGIVNYDKNAANGQEREKGFREIIEKDSRVAYVKTTNVRSNTEDAREGTRKLLMEHPEINVVATFNEWTSLGVGWAIRDLALQDKTRVVAFDSNVVSVGMLESGEVDALIVQNPYAMGYLGVEAAWKLLNGIKMEKLQVDTETTMVNRENMFTSECQKILFPYD